MTPALERLAELVRQAEARTRARKLETETQHAAEQFRAAESRTRKAAERLRSVRPASLRSLEQADTDEQLLKDLVRKLALYKSTLGSEADAEQLIATSQAEIERTRRQARTDLEEASHDLDEARRELRVVTDQYRQLRRELDRLQPELAQQFAAEDRLLWDAEAHFPGGQLNLLGHEVDAGIGAFGSLNKHEQYARLKVWIGRFRLPGFPGPRGRIDRRATGLVASGFPPAQVALQAVRAWLHRSVPPGLYHRLGRLRRRGSGTVGSGN